MLGKTTLRMARRAKLIASLVCACRFLGAVGHAATFTWAGSASTDWFNAGNWTPQGIPAPTDTVNFASGTITFTALVALGGQFNWSGGTLGGNPLTITRNGALNISGGSTKYLVTALTNSGTVTWSGSGNLEVDYSSANNQFGLIENTPAGTWNIQNSARLYNTAPNSAYFRNAGIVQKSADTSTTTISIPFYNSGSVSVVQGTFQLTAGGTIENSWSAATGAAINLNAGSFTYNTAPVVTGAGLIELTGGSITLIDDSIPNLQLRGGTISLGSSFQAGGQITNLVVLGGTLTGNNSVQGTFTSAANLPGSLQILSGSVVNWMGGSMQGPVNVSSGGALLISSNNTKYLWGALTNAGTVAWTGTGGLEVDYSTANNQLGTIENLAGALWDIHNSTRLYNNAPNGAYFHNAGTLQKSSDSGTTTISVPVNNSGTLSASQGILLLSGGGNLGGRINAAGGATINLNGGTWTYSIPPSIPGAGLVELTAGTLTLADDVIPKLQLMGGVIGLSTGFQGGAVTNLTLQGGTLLGNLTVKGVLNTGANLPGNLILLSGAAVTWTAGSIQGPVTIASGASLILSGSSQKYLWGALTNAGTVTWAGNGNLEVDYASANNQFGLIENLPGGSWDIQGSARMYNSAPNSAYFRNAGTVQKSADTGLTTISIPFYNSGGVSAFQGTLLFNGGGTIEGSWNAASSAILNLNGGPFTYTAPPTIMGPGLVEMTGGSLTLANDIIPNLQLGGGIITLGSNFQGGQISNLMILGGTLLGNAVVSGSFVTGANLPGNLTLLSGAVVNWIGGSIQGSVNIAQGSSMIISSNSTKYLWGPLTNAGTVSWAGNGGLEVDYSSANAQFGVIENLAGGLWDIQGSSRLYNSAPNGAYFHNAGTVQKSADPGMATISIPFSNLGTTKALMGTLAFNGGISLTGGTLVNGLGDQSSYGQFSLSGSNALSGGLVVNLIGGFVPALGNSFTLVSYSAHNGSFAPFNVPAAAQWLTNYGQTTLTLTVAEVQKLVLLANPNDNIAGAVLAPMVVQIFDSATGQPLATSGVPVTVALSSGNGVVSGTLTRDTDASGKATFNDLSINLVGGKTLTFTAPGMTPATTSFFAIDAGAGAQLAIVKPITGLQLDGGVLQPTPIVQVLDAFGNVVTRSTAPITARVTAGATGFLGGTTTTSVDGNTGSAVLTNLTYSLGNPLSSESISIYFSSPGLTSATNPPVLVNFIFSLITLQSGNSVVQIDPTSSQGVFSWKVDGAETLYQQWYWLRQGNNGPQSSLDGLSQPLGVALTSSNATIKFVSAPFNVTLGFVLEGGASGNGSSDLAQSLSIQNKTNTPLAIHVFQYADFNLAGPMGADTVAFPTAGTVAQQGGSSQMTETVQSPAPTYWEASLYPLTVDKISSATPVILSDAITPASAGDQTFGYQWDLSLLPGQTIAIASTQRIRAATAPSSTLSLTIVSSQPDLTISWPTNGAAGFQLQSANSFDANATWSSVTNLPNVIGETYQIMLPPAAGVRFFRLKH